MDSGDNLPGKTKPQINTLDRRFQLLMESVTDYGIFFLSPTGIIETWNQGAKNIKGYEADEIIGRHFSTFYTDIDLASEKPKRELEVATATGRYEEEGWRVRKNGDQFWASVVITVLKDADLKVVGFAKITRDLSEKKASEEALKESEERFRLIVASVRDYAIIMLNTEGEISSWNEGARRLKGYDASEIIGKHFSAFYDEDDVASGKCEYELREAIATGRLEDEGWRIRKDGTKFWANVVITALRDDTGELRGFSKVTRDMTERKRAEDKLRMAHEQLERRVEQRTKALEAAVSERDEFLSIAAHELRTPLSNLNLQYQLLRRQIAKAPNENISPKSLLEISELTSRQVSQLVRLVDDMFDTSRIAKGSLNLDLAPTNLSDLVAAVCSNFAAKFEADRVTVTSHIEKNMMIDADGSRIEQVLSNLITNALKYGQRRPIEIRLARERDEAFIEVTDSGPGIQVTDQSRIFERFERAISSNEISGLGLGLYISRKIIDLHGGSLILAKSGAAGSTFRIILPLRK